jgi:glycine hydroxymethyltransferase
MVAISREELLLSLQRQKRALTDSIVLTPTDSIPFALADRKHTAFLHGLYISDKDRDRDAQKDAIIQFSGRGAAARDITAIHRLLADAFGASEGSLRLLAGLQAHTATFMSVAAIGQTVMLLSAQAGGHYNTHAILQRLGLRTVDMPIDSDRLCIDRAATLAMIDAVHPDFVFVDRSEGLRYEDFSFIGQLEGPTTIFDASHFVTQILTRRYENPLAWGFDLMLFTLHKSFPGPQKAAIVSRESGELWASLQGGLSTLVSSSHAENTYLTGLVLLREEWLDSYCRRMLDTASALEAALLRRGVPVIGRERQGEPHWPATHHIWISAEDRNEAFRHYEELGRVNIHTNYRLLPYDLGYGLRLGTTACAVAGIDLPHVEELADIIATTLVQGGSPALLGRVATLADQARRTAILQPEHWT